MQITVLGKSPAWQDAGGACSGYLVQEGDTCILIDCGNGVFSKLRCHHDYADVEAVVITHLHADHILDLIPYASALTYAPRRQPVPVGGWPGDPNPHRPALHVPAGAKEAFSKVCEGGGMFSDHVETAFDFRQYEPGDTVTAGSLTVRFGSVPHYLPTCAVEVSNGSGRFTFGADSAPNDEIVEFAKGTDLLMLEATLPRPERNGIRGHLTPGEAGDHAARAGAGRLVLTHMSDELDRDWALDEARKTFGGDVDIAAEGAVYEV